MHIAPKNQQNTTEKQIDKKDSTPVDAWYILTLNEVKRIFVWFSANAKVSCKS